MMPKFRNALLGAALITTAPHTLSAVIEEVIITAQKRAESVNDIGVSASAFSGDQLKDVGIDSAVDLGSHTPGLVTVNSTSGGTPIFAIRGIGLDDFSANNSSGVGVYTDEVFASSPAYLGGQLFDIERVEVLKGPQGTLYGKNTTGGAINFITNKPTETLEGYVEADYSRFDTLEVTAAVSNALSDNVRGRVSLNYVKSQDGWQQDDTTGEEFGLQDRFAIRGQLAFDFGDNGDGNLRVYYSSDESKPLSPDSEGIGDALFIPELNVLNSNSDARKVNVGNLDVKRDESGHGIALTLNYSFENFDFVSISAYDAYERDIVDNYDGSAASTMTLLQDNELSQWSQELRFVSNSTDGFNWVAGFNISNENVEVIDIFDDSFLVTDAAATGVLTQEDIDAFGLDQFISDYTQETDSYGFYLHTETELSDVLALTVGVRYSYDDRSFDGNNTNLSFGESFDIVRLDEAHDEDALTGKIGIDWDVNEDILAYASVSTSYKSGVYYGAAVVDSDAWSYIKPEDVLAWEAGFKWNLFDGSMQLNGAVFMLEYENRQSLFTFVSDEFSELLGFPVLDTTLASIPESETKGFEMDLYWLPTDELTISAGVAYLDTEVTKAPSMAELRGINPDPTANDQATEDGFGFVDALGAALPEGTPLSQAPQWSYNGLIAYETPLTEDWNIRLQTSYSWVDEQFAQLADANAQYGEIESLDAMISFNSSDETLSVSLWGRNLQNNDADTYSFTGFAGRTVYRQQPTTYGVNVKYNFM
ncbi:TonB-dependent receptor [Pseudomaricurvus alkylphenolicus]|uniref:TonB-dependent receptor n=1 Tax=Pseudomaricurvus alkylphenolicus TaxID=1306991 RepID=UPI00141FA8BF|nr:TonB-dependent receptor [Pseudomaricurvus alkylphenolicus]NIB39936.1 TonB-dependent receptor [Pseudomaricurvus alkylphenolicus]